MADTAAASAAKTEDRGGAPIAFDTHPERYAHWKLGFDGPLATLKLVRAPPRLQQAPEVTITPRTVARTRTPAVRLARMSPPTALTLLPTWVKRMIAATVTNSPSTIRLRGENTVAIWRLRSMPKLMLS